MDTLFVRLTIPAVGLAGDFNLQVSPPGRAHKKETGSNQKRIESARTFATEAMVGG